MGMGGLANGDTPVIAAGVSLGERRSVADAQRDAEAVALKLG